MEGHCSTGRSPQWAVVPMEGEEDSTRNEECGQHSDWDIDLMTEEL